MTKWENTYSLGGGLDEQKRLEEQQRMYGDDTYITVKVTDTVCEVGCGVGANLWVASKLSEGAYIGIDSQPQQIEACQQKAMQWKLSNVTFYCADARSLPLKDICVDMTFCRLLLIHLPDPELALKEMVRITRPGGRLIAIEPEVKAFITNKPALMKCFHARTRHIYRPQHGSIDVARRLESLFQQQGLTQVEIIQHDIKATGAEKDRLAHLLLNWAMLNRPVAEELIADYDVTRGELEQAEREVNELTEDDYVYQRLWIARGVK